MRMDLINVLRLSYLGAALDVLFVSVTPALSHRLLAYGPRASKTIEKEKIDKQTTATPNTAIRLLDIFASWTVPHDYFWTFYLLSTTLSIFWLGEILWLKGPTLDAIDRLTATRAASMSFEQVKIAWIMMLVQGSRRLYESLGITNSSGIRSISKMQASHWILGLLFYLATSMAVWIEGIPVLRHHQVSLRDLALRAPTLRTVVGVVVFMLASGIQHDCHVHLAHLKSSKTKDGTGNTGEYKIPTHPAFQSIIAPHYTAECMIYLSLAIVAAPRGHMVNTTLSCALIFVVVNLGVTAGGTRQWYEKRFGPEAVKGKWNIIPYVY